MLSKIIETDVSLFWLINSHHSPVLDRIFGGITAMGNAWIMVPLIAMIIVWRTPRQALRHTLVFSLTALCLTGLLTSVIKQTVHRPRPARYFVTVDNPRPAPLSWYQPVETVSRVHVVGPMLRYRSFPSGHTSTAVGCALVLIVLYGRWFWLGCIPALAVAYSRVYLGAHFPLDTVMAMGIVAITIGLTWLGFKWRNGRIL
jgi:undecaprenyl-diphosphatase